MHFPFKTVYFVSKGQFKYSLEIEKYLARSSCVRRWLSGSTITIMIFIQIKLSMYACVRKYFVSTNDNDDKQMSLLHLRCLALTTYLCVAIRMICHRSVLLFIF